MSANSLRIQKFFQIVEYAKQQDLPIEEYKQMVDQSGLLELLDAPKIDSFELYQAIRADDVDKIQLILQYYKNIGSITFETINENNLLPSN